MVIVDDFEYPTEESMREFISAILEELENADFEVPLVGRPNGDNKCYSNALLVFLSKFKYIFSTRTFKYD